MILTTYIHWDDPPSINAYGSPQLGDLFFWCIWRQRLYPNDHRAWVVIQTEVLQAGMIPTISLGFLCFLSFEAS